jgi:hypothetical protein
MDTVAVGTRSVAGKSFLWDILWGSDEQWWAVNQHPTGVLESVCLYVTTFVSRDVPENFLGRSSTSIAKIMIVALT